MKKVEIDERAHLLVNHVINEMEYGEIITHQRVSTIVGVEELFHDYYKIIKAAKIQLIPCGKVIESKRGKGYKVVEPDDYSRYANDMFLQGEQLINRAKDVTMFAPKELMSEEARMINWKVGEHIGTCSAMLRQRAEELSLIIHQNSQKEGDEEK